MNTDTHCNPEKRENLTKIMQKIVLFIELSDDTFQTPSKIGHLFTNRFAIDEDASFEILKIFHLGKTSLNMSRPKGPQYGQFETERKEKGMSLVNTAGILE